MSSEQIPTLQECRDRFASFSECKHYEKYKKWIRPYGCRTENLTCLVCAKHFDTRYLKKVSGKQIREEILTHLINGDTNKQVIYGKIVDDLGAKRPSIRRIAGDLKKDLQGFVDILDADVKYVEKCYK